jgi:predicted Zn-dependent protease
MYRLFLFAGAILILAISAAGQTGQPCQPPIAVSQQPNIFSEAQEADLGDAIAEHIQRDLRVIDDEDVTAYLSRIGGRIVKRLQPSRLRFQFLLIDLPDANAFVLPGGRIYVSRKLVAQAQTEDELAGVLGHEIGHLAARQGSIQMTRLLREVLGVNEVKDRRDIFEKYNQLVENTARKPRAGGNRERAVGRRSDRAVCTRERRVRP